MGAKERLNGRKKFPATSDKTPIPTPLSAEYAGCEHGMQTKRCKLFVVDPEKDNFCRYVAYYEDLCSGEVFF